MYHYSKLGKRNAILLWALMGKLACLLVLAGVTGCARGTGKTFALMSPPPGQSLIYHYRLSPFVSYRGIYYVFANEEPLVGLVSVGYYPQVVAPGRMTYKSFPGTKYTLLGRLAVQEPVIELETESGEIRFVKWIARAGPWGPKVPKAKEVSSEVAMKEMKNLKQFSEWTESEKQELRQGRNVFLRLDALRGRN